jgi:hypothetical protein
MRSDAGTLSVDFLAGFTIFMVAFVWVATMIPGMLVSLNARGVDYDAVAYRTGVILLEDPGWPSVPAWETYTDAQKYDVPRFGLAVSKDTPNILMQSKIDRFFCTTVFIYPEDYRQRVIFGDYPYLFNISLRDDAKGTVHQLGDVLPDGYGYIRRVAKIKGSSNATIGETQIRTHGFNSTAQVTRHEFSIAFNYTRLMEQKDFRYQIDPVHETVMVNITDLGTTIGWDPAEDVAISLTQIRFYGGGYGNMSPIPFPRSQYPFIDGSPERAASLPAGVKNNISFIMAPAQSPIFSNLFQVYPMVYINMTFDLDRPSTFLNNSFVSPFEYNYYPENVTQPRLRDAIVEVAVW